MNPLMLALGGGLFAVILATILVMAGVPGTVAGVIVFLAVIWGSMAMSKSLHKKQ